MIWLAFAYELLVVAYIGMTKGTDTILTAGEKFAILTPLLAASCWAAFDLSRSIMRMRNGK